MLTRRILAILFLVGLCLPIRVSAEGIPSARILITEIQTESDNSALDDFIELTNRSDSDVDVTGWEIQTKATGATSDWIKRVILDGIIHPEGSIILSYADSSHSFLADIASGNFSSGLSTTGGHVRILDTNLVAEEDKVGWGTAQDAETASAPKPLKPSSLTRKNVSGLFIDTNNNSLDFELTVPSPRADNTNPVEEESEETPVEEPVEDPEVPVEEEAPTEIPPESTPEESEIPEAPEEASAPPSTNSELPLLPIRINEILPDPITPQTDANDEWIELYNPNTEDVNLKDYKLQTGLKFTYSFTFTDTVIPAGGFLTITSGEATWYLVIPKELLGCLILRKTLWIYWQTTRRLRREKLMRLMEVFGNGQ